MSCQPNSDSPIESDQELQRLVSQRRPRETIGDVVLSIQAGQFIYCNPQDDDLPIDQYTTVEVGLWPVEGAGWFVPSDVGFDGMDGYWERRHPVTGSTVGRYVPREQVARLREYLLTRSRR